MLYHARTEIKVRRIFTCNSVHHGAATTKNGLSYFIPTLANQSQEIKETLQKTLSSKKGAPKMLVKLTPEYALCYNSFFDKNINNVPFSDFQAVWKSLHEHGQLDEVS